ncbi:hypothetical protein HQQ80_12765 [Microbacteriaceae bacterium VKM Ac-2855]|nr:hypothetical protein [Microbacteriaceae bacterium VKM Ac-2855]
MQLYSASPVARARQLSADVLALASIVGFGALGSTVGALIGSTAALGRGLADAGEGFEGTMTDASSALAGIPLLGSAASTPFSQAGAAGATLAQAGRDQQSLIETVAWIIGLLIALVPIAVVLLVWLRRRIGFARRAASARRLAAAPGGRDLLALRALSSVEPRILLALDTDVAARWRDADPQTVDALAALALREAGVTR